jgi:peptidoglycan/LPS O-acetylase OafA/YrhL
MHVTEARKPDAKIVSGKSVPYLDGIRGLAVLTILIYHCWLFSDRPEINLGLPLTPILDSSATAIDLFFVLSAFLLSQQWLKADYLHLPRPSTLKYYKQRFFRIAPAYYCCILVMLVAFTPGYLSPGIVYSFDGLGYLAAHLTFTHYLFPASSSIYYINATVWTLTHEVTFYLILPWFVLLFLRNKWQKTLPILFVIVIGWIFLSLYSLEPVVNFWQNITPAYANDRDYIRYFLSNQFIAYLVDFGLGIVAANLYVQKSLNLPLSKTAQFFTRQNVANTYFLIGVVVVVGSDYLVKNIIFHYFLLHISVAAGYTLMLMGLVFGGITVKKVFSTPLLRYSGVIGYSVFLWHMPLIYFIKSISPIAELAPFPKMLAILAVTSILVGIISTISYRLIEKPFMDYSRRIKAHSKTSPKLLNPNLEGETRN